MIQVFNMGSISRPRSFSAAHQGNRARAHGVEMRAAAVRLASHFGIIRIRSQREISYAMHTRMTREREGGKEIGEAEDDLADCKADDGALNEAFYAFDL